MSSLYLLTWEKVRVWLLGLFILFFVTGVFVLMHTGQQIAPMTVETSVDTEDFGQFMSDHYALLAPFFEKNREDLVTQGEPLLIRVMGDVILLNMAIDWVLAAGLAFGFAYFYAHRQADIVKAMIYATWRLGLDIIIFLMASLGAFGWEQLDLPIPVTVILVLFVLVEILVQSILVATIYHTHAAISTVFYIVLLLVLVGVGTLVSGSVIKKRVAIMLSQFADVPSVTADLQSATAEGNRLLNIADSSRDDALHAVDQAQDQLNQLKAQQDAVLKDIQTKEHSEAFVYSRIMRIRASGDLTSARDQMTAFLTQFPNGTLFHTASAQLAVINQDIAIQQAAQQQAEADAAKALAQARADLQARAANGDVPLDEMRHALLGKTPDDVSGLFGQPTVTGSDRWDYSHLMVVNPLTNEKYGLSVYFVQGVVQSVDYYSGN
jgi:hypothetical protein